MLFLNKVFSDTDICENLLSGASKTVYSTPREDTLEYVNDMVIDYLNIDQHTVSNRQPFAFGKPDLAQIDWLAENPFEDCDDLMYIAGLFINKAITPRMFPVETSSFVGVDILASSLAYAIKGDTQTAFAFYQVAMKFFSMIAQTEFEPIHIKPKTNTRITPYVL
jgi:hypothetical protein